MPAKRDLTGLKIGKLTVIKENGRRNGKILWQCKCDCGNIVNIVSSQLTKKNPTQSCGCLQKEKTREANQSKDLSGKVYGYLTVLNRKPNSSQWICQCKCGNIIEVSTNHLNSGHTQSCGCYQKEQTRKTHFINLINNQYGLLTVIALDPNSQPKNLKWICQCECGNIISVKNTNLISGNTQSCGCSRLSHGEIKIKQLLDKYKIPYEMEKSFPTCINPKTGKLLRFDFYVNNKYLIEYDGIQHYQNTFEPNNPQTLIDTQYRDTIKNEWCKKNKIPLIRIPYTKYNELSIIDLLL